MVARIIQLGDAHTQEIVSDRVSLIRQEFKRPGKNGRTSKIKAFYIGADSWQEAQAITQTFRGRTKIRAAQRVTDWDYEVKFQGDFNEQEIEAIAKQLDSLALFTVPTQRKIERTIPSKRRVGTMNYYKTPIRPLDLRRRHALFA